MRSMMLLKPDPATAANAASHGPGEELMTAMGKLTEEPE